MAKGAMPVLVGVGQSVSQWDGKSGPAGAPSPLSLATDASQAALADSGATGVAAALDAIAFVRIFEDSVPGDRHPHGHNTNLPGTLARNIGATPRDLIYADVGGQTPQALVNEMARRIHECDIEAALITGSEANRASKGARRNGVEIDWADSADTAFEDRGMGPMLLSRTEIKHGLIAPAYFYALFENAMAGREGQTRTQRRAAMSALWERFASVAATHPYAQFPTARSAAFLATPSSENFPIADPFLKWHVAQDAVNQGAAAIVMSEEKADALGVPPSKRVYLHGGGEAEDGFLSERARLDGSAAMEDALTRALHQAGKTSADIDLFDLYSCFPCAVFSSTAALGIDPDSDPRPLTVTGGLPFFGGPGNNYSLHAIASMADRLRAAPGQFGLVLANGGWMTKEAAGVYSTSRPATFTPAAPCRKPTKEVEIDPSPTGGIVESFTVVHARKGENIGIASCRTEAGARFLARAIPDALARLEADESPVGASVTSEQDGEVNIFGFV